MRKTSGRGTFNCDGDPVNTMKLPSNFNEMLIRNVRNIAHVFNCLFNLNFCKALHSIGK